MSERAKKVLGVTFRRDEVKAMTALLRKLSLGGQPSEVALLARNPAVASAQAKFSRLLAKSEASQ